MGAELFHAERRVDGRTDMTGVNVVDFRNYMNALENFSPICMKMFALCHRVIQKRQSNFATVLPPLSLYAVDKQASMLAFTDRKHTSKKNLSEL